MKVRLIAHTPNPGRLVASAGRLCYSNQDIDNIYYDFSAVGVEQMVDKLTSLGHTSTLEHVSFTFGISGISRITAQQILRHRIASYSMQSARYTEHDGDFVAPPSMQQYDLQWYYYSCMQQYKHLIALGVPKEDARYVLPQSQTCKLIVTMNARALHHFFSLRCCNRAQWEIREVANEMLRLAREASPMLFKKAGKPCEHGECPEGALSCMKRSEDNAN